MRSAAALLMLLVSVPASQAQSPAPGPMHVRTLTIVSADLPQADSQRIARALEGKSYDGEELQERIRLSVRNLGYYDVQVDALQVSMPTRGPAAEGEDVSVKVETGARYTLGAIQFHNATIFPPEQLRSQFPIKTGSFFNVTSIQYGLEKLKDLYNDKGYINFGAIPKPAVDGTRHIVDLTLDLDEGKPYVFGHLLLAGVEPHAGAGSELVASWSSLQGKTYNPDLLKNWLLANWPAAPQNPYQMLAIDNQPHEVNLRIQFP